jgi:hypothetical protein
MSGIDTSMDFKHQETGYNRERREDRMRNIRYIVLTVLAIVILFILASTSDFNSQSPVKPSKQIPKHSRVASPATLSFI